MFHHGRNKPNFKKIISQTSNFKERANFLLELEPLFLESFRGSQTQFQRLVMLRMDVYVPADLSSLSSQAAG